MPVIYVGELRMRPSAAETYLLGDFLHVSNYKVVAFGMVKDWEAPRVFEGHKM
jgi:hypothetical protein